MTKNVTFGKHAMEKMLLGLNKASEAVSGTLGPKGRNVYLDDPMLPTITNDGATIADKIILEDKLENAGAYVIRNVTSQTNDDVGDGTTTTAVLTQAIVHECLKRPENSMETKQSLKEAGEKVLKILAKKSIPLKKEDIERIALISSEDKNIARLITEIIDKLGEKAVINVEDSKTFATDYEITDGYEAGVGFMSPHFINDKSGKVVYSDIPILVSEKKISSLADIAPIFEMFKTEQINHCVIICEEIDDSMLGILVNSKKMGTFNSLVIRANGWLLQDIERATGAIAVSDSNGVTFKNFTKDKLGYAKKIICDANKTLFLTEGTAGKDFADFLEKQADLEQNMYTQKNMKQRVAKLRGGLAVLRIGASTDFERDYLRRKAEDSVKAVQAALAEGYVEGGGMALWRIAQQLPTTTIGLQILKKAMTAPLRKIIDNAGKDYADIVGGMRDSDGIIEKRLGYNAKTDTYENLIEAGIIDPSKVTRCALENAISAASTFCTTFALITDIPEDNKK